MVVKQNSRVKDLKRAIEAFYGTEKARKQYPNIAPAINWKYTWKNFSLAFKGTKLLDDNRALTEYGISNKCELEFSRNMFR